MKLRVQSVLALASLPTAVACSGAGAGEDVAQASAQITQVPAQVACVDIKVAGARTIDARSAVAQGQSSVVNLNGLPIGAVTFTAQAYQEACSAITSTSVPTWIGDPVAATLNATTVTNITIVLHRNGRAAVGVDFQDDDAGAPTGPSTPTVLATDPNVNPAVPTPIMGMVTDGSMGYWVSPSTNGNNGAVLGVPLGGGAVTTFASGLAPVQGLALAGTAAYTGLPSGQLEYVPVSPSGQAFPVAGGGTRQPGVLVGSGSKLAWSDDTNVYSKDVSVQPATYKLGAGMPAFRMAADASNVYWTVRSSPSSSPGVWKSPFNNPAPTMLAGEAANVARGVAVDAANVYWSRDDGSISFQPLAGGSSVTLVPAGAAGLPDCLASDGSSLYFMTKSSIMKVSVTGGTPTTLALLKDGDNTNANSLAVTATSVVWTTANQVLSVPK